MDRADEAIGARLRAAGRHRSSWPDPGRPRPVNTSGPVGEPSWIATLCGIDASWLSNSIWNGVSAGAVSAVGSKRQMSLGRRPASGGSPAGRRRTARRTAGSRSACGDALAVEPRVELGAGQRMDVEHASTLWPTPHSSAHWPRKVWPASASLIVNSNAVDPTRDDVALEQELRDVEGVDDVRAAQGTAGRSARPAGRGRRRAPRADVCVYSGSGVRPTVGSSRPGR